MDELKFGAPQMRNNASGQTSVTIQPPMKPPSQDSEQNGDGIISQKQDEYQKTEKGKPARKRASDANKAAQQRYRERKKLKIANMESELEALKSKLEEFQAIKKRNEYLENMNATLQVQMVEKEIEVERLRSVGMSGLDGTNPRPQELRNSALPRLNVDASGVAGSGQVKCESPALDSGSNGTSNRDGTGDGCRHCLGAPDASTVGRAPGDSKGKKDAVMSCAHLDMDRLEMMASQRNADEVKGDFFSQIEEIKATMAKYDVSEHHMEGEGDVASNLSKEACEELWGAIMKACQACYVCLQSSGPDVAKLIGEWHRDGNSNDRWVRALHAMNLRSEQKTELLLLRSRHLDTMKKIYEERQRLNLLAISKMVVAPIQSPEDATIEAKMQCLSSVPSMGLSGNNASLNDALDKIKANLRMEQKAVMSLNCTTLTQILNCVQAARYMVCVYPQHCDALALANALHQTESHTSDGNASTVSE